MKFNVLSGNMLKVIAAVCMAIDHIGMLFFPKIAIFRIIGRVAFPIFAYMIAEGCRYTKNKLKYFGLIFFPAAICQSAYYLVDNKGTYMCVLITFSLSILMIYALQYFKKAVFAREKSVLKILLGGAFFVCLVWGTRQLNRVLQIDYGFWGSMLPVLISVFQPVGREDKSILNKTDHVFVHIVMMTLGLLLLSFSKGAMNVQIYSLLAALVMLLYSGEKGKWNMKYFFYVFYPVHLAVLGGIYLLIG